MFPSWLESAFAILLGGCGVKFAVDALWIVLTRRPVNATVIADSYGEARSYAAKLAHPLDWVHEIASEDGAPEVNNDLTARYVVDGETYEATVRVSHARGSRPDQSLTLWYDPADPASADNDAPGGRLYLAVALLAMAVWVAGWLG